MPSAGGVVAAALVILFCGAGDGAARRVRSISLALQPCGCGGGTVLGLQSRVGMRKKAMNDVEVLLSPRHPSSSHRL